LQKRNGKPREREDQKSEFGMAGVTKRVHQTHVFYLLDLGGKSLGERTQQRERKSGGKQFGKILLPRKKS